MKKTVSAGWYCWLLCVKTSSQNFCTLFTTATMRQSSRWFASSPVLHSCETSEGVESSPTALVVERAELPGEPSAASGERGHEQVDDEDGDADPAAADREPARAADSAPADVPYLARIEPGAFAKPHEASITGRLSAPNA